ncbi:PHD finger protein 20-like protein 1 isoform X2 [Dendronephthya gigantea]|uniref:PHD finger protein 20-like protein 1 isoform X2 n=1 Tax=Dendronephthya gigantea TaxID=151771 RepID=UPI00106A8D41|nr:PHD finger protein 20-like protein 1 isoform X2 [Dendronephthya gigantea]
MSSKSTNSASSSPTSSKDNSPNKLEFVVGNRIEAMDYMCNWYVSKIAKVDHKKKKILIHFEGWNSRYDEWVSFDSKKIRPLPKEKVKSKSKAKEFKVWKEGDIVSAKWSDGTYYPAEIVKVISKDFYEVEYDDGFQKIIHQSKIREQDSTNKRKKPPSSSVISKPERKAKLAQDRASRARRRSGKDEPMLSPQSSETIEQKEEKIEKDIEKIEEEKVEVKSKDVTETSRKRNRRESDVPQESKRPKTEEAIETKPGQNQTKHESCEVESSDKLKQSEDSVSLVPPLNKSKTVGPQNIEKDPSKMSESLNTSSADDTLPSENTIRVTHIKESKPDSQMTKPSVTTPLSVQVDQRTDIQQVIIPDKDMKILQTTGVLGLLNVQEPCVILGTSLAGSTTATSAAEEVLSKCKIASKVTTELEEVSHHGKALKTKKNQGSSQAGKDVDTRLQEKAELSKTTPDPKQPKDRNKGESVDAVGCVDTSKGIKNQALDDKDIESTTLDKEEKNLKTGDSGEIAVEKPIPEQLSATEDDTSSNVDERDKDDTSEHAQKSDQSSKGKPQTLGAESFKAKRMRLDQITGKLSIQRQTQITAKREEIKQKLDHLKSEEMTKTSHITPQTYQKTSPNPPPYPRVSAPAPRLPPQYVERYPPPSLFTYGAPPQCTGPCCTYPPGNSYPPASTAGYHLSPGGLPRETYVVYGPGTQASFPVIAPTLAHPPCSCCSLYPTAVLHEPPQNAPSLMRLMHVDQRLPPSVVYTQTTPHSGERPKISPRGISPRDISSECRKPGRVHVTKKMEQDSGTKTARSEDLSSKTLPTSNKSSKDINTTNLSRSSTGERTDTPSKLNSSQFKPIDGTPTNTSDVNLSTHLSAHLTSNDPSFDSTPSKKAPPSRLNLDPDDLPLSRLVGVTTPGVSTPGDKAVVGTKNSGGKTPVTSPSDSDALLGDMMSTPLPPDGHPGKGLRRPHVFAPKELRIELDHNKFKCEYSGCDKSFRKASLLDSHVKYYHTSPEDKRKRSSASWSEEDSFESGVPKKRTKRQSTSDVSIGSVGDNSLEAQSPAASDIHVEVEHDLEDEMEMDISDTKEEDVVRCLCDVFEDSGLMIQCEQCFTWQHNDCVNAGEEKLPSKYICYVCRNPKGLRKNARFKNNYEWFKSGILPAFVPHDVNEVKIVKAQVTHSMLSDLYKLNSGLKGMKRKLHILRTPNHVDLKMWEHKHEVFKDDSLRSDADSSKNESNASEYETNDVKSLNNELEKDDQTRGNDVVDDQTRESLQTRGNDVVGDRQKVVRDKDDKDGSEVIRSDSEIQQKEGETTGLRQEKKTQEMVSGSVENVKNKNCVRTDIDSTQSSMEEETEQHNGQENEELTRENDIQARDGKESTRESDVPARDGKESTRDNDIEARDRKALERNTLETARSLEETSGQLNDSEIIQDSNDENTSLRNDETGTSTRNNMKYTGDDLAFVNLLEEIEDDQTFLDEQLDRLEKQVEILEKSLASGTTERRPSIRKLSKQLLKLQKLGFVF